MKVNEIQIGGTHYKELPYQHWDVCDDTFCPYLLGCATKYIARWRKKGGIQDLEKAIHFIRKADEKNKDLRYVSASVKPHYRSMWRKFCEQLNADDSKAIWAIINDEFDYAITLISKMIEDEECGAGKNYVNQDPNYIRG